MRSIELLYAQVMRPLVACGRWLRLHCKRAAQINSGLIGEFAPPQARRTVSSRGFQGRSPWCVELKGRHIAVF